MRRRRVERSIWVRDWIARRPQLGLYDRLMVELRNEDPRKSKSFYEVDENASCNVRCNCAETDTSPYQADHQLESTP